MMNATKTSKTIASLIVYLTTCGAAVAQDVVVSEIHADPNQAWVEIHNRSAGSVDLSSWSLHYASKTAGMPQNYWWPFPAGTTLDTNEFMRVHWYEPTPATPAVGSLYTGTSPYGFLFGLGGEPLSGDQGALALLRTQSNSSMNTATVIEDWVSWGDNGFQREPLAVQAGLWTSNRSAPSIPAGSSLARNAALIGSTSFADETWFVDNTPTPMQPNVVGAAVDSYGEPCTLPGHHLLGNPELRATSLPILGNAEFGLAIDHTTGVYGEFALVGYSVGAALPGAPTILPPFAGAGCREAIDTQQLLATWLLTHERDQHATLPAARQLAGFGRWIGAACASAGDRSVAECLPAVPGHYQRAADRNRAVTQLPVRVRTLSRRRRTDSGASPARHIIAIALEPQSRKSRSRSWSKSSSSSTPSSKWNSTQPPASRAI